MGPEGAFLFGGSFGEADWKEAVDLYSPAQFSCGRRRAVATLTAFIYDFEKLKSCIHWLRGYAWVDENKKLRRSRPARHPIWPNLVCTEIVECVGLQFDEKQDIISSEMDLPFARYEKFKLTASFSAPPYLIAEDGEVDTEDERWTTFEPKPYVDFYAAPAGEFTFIADNPLKAWNTVPVQTPMTVIRSQKSLYTLKWYDVPISFIRNDDGATPKLDGAIGKVSSDVYAGKDIGTFLIDDVDVDIFNDPIVGDILDTPGRMADVTFHLKYWNPTSGHATNATRGWNLELAVDGDGYPVQRKVGTDPKYQSVSMASLFTHWSV